MKKSLSLFAVLTAVTLVSMPAFSAAPEWIVDPATSHLNFVTKQGDKDIKGEFKKFTPVISFDKNDLASSHISVTIDTGSATTGDATSDASLTTKDWFNVASFPEATFKSTSVTATGTDTYDAKGTLTILGVSKDIILPFSLKEDNGKTRATGTTSIKRLDFDLGKSVDPSGAMVSNDVTISFDITAQIAAPVQK